MRALRPTPSDRHSLEGNRRTPAASRPSLQRGAVALAICGGLLSLSMAHAESLVELHQAAKAYDAAYLSAKTQAEATRFQVEQAYGLSRPTLGLQAGINRSRYDSSESPDPAAVAQAQAQGQTLSYDTMATTQRIALQGKYALYNPNNDAKISQAEQQLNLIESDLQIAENDLAARLAKAYFDVLSAQDVLTATQANKKAVAEQLASAKRSFEVGNATITDTREAQARHDLAEAQEIFATNDLRFKRIALDQVVGRSNVQPSPLRPPYKLDALATGDMDEWVNRASTGPLVRKASIALDVTRIELDKARAGHLPTLDLVGTLSRSRVKSANATYNVNSGSGTTGLIGLEFNLPLYTGGAAQNRINEVTKLLTKAESDRDNALRTTTLGTRQAYTAVQSGLAQVKALEAAEASAKLALEATQLGYKVGVRINKDVLDAFNFVANTQRDLYRTRYDVIVGSVKLKQAAGILRDEDIVELNNMLVQP
jgi:outer membrane protein